MRVSDDLGLHPAMTGLRELYDEGLLSIVNSVGYPNPNRSHFRSMDIWQTGSGSKENWTTGWIGRFLDNHCSGCEEAHYALEIDDSLSLAMKGYERSGFAMSKPMQLRKTTEVPFLKTLGEQYQNSADHSVDYLYKTMIDTQSSAQYLYQKSKVHRAKGNYPNTAFGNDVKLIAELITADADTQIYYVSLSGFDTHINQKAQQQRLLKQYAQAMKALISDLKAHNLLEDTLIMTFSEFGRRVKQNGSRGTDHGTANNLFLMGGALQQAGFYNDAPDLRYLDNGDLRYQIDFRNIYATIIEEWLEADARSILAGSFDRLALLNAR